MIESLSIAATGMHAQQLQIDTIANNLANVNTSGFKKNRVDFEDLMYRQAARANGPVGEAGLTYPVGVGTAVAGAGKVFTVEDVKKTDRPLDVAIRGDGFFEVELPDGSYGYTRTGVFQINEDGVLITQDGYTLNPAIQVPSDAEEILFMPDGTVLARLPGEVEPTELGRIELARFVNPAGLTALGSNLYLPSHTSGEALHATPGENGIGALAQGYLEASNVQLVEELTNLVLAQRAYEINSKVIQASDELLGIVNNLRR